MHDIATVLSRGVRHQTNLPPWGIGLVGLTVVIFMVTFLAVDYIFGNVLPMLLIIESPNETITFTPLATSDPDCLPKDPEPEASSRPVYLTSSFRETAKYLQSIGGVRSLFRGIAIYIVAHIVIFLLSSALDLVPFIPGGVATVLASVACAQLSWAWTHIVLTPPQRKPWFRRLPPTKIWTKIALPTAIFAITEQISFFIQLSLLNLTGILQAPKATASLSPGEQFLKILSLFGIVAFGMLLAMVLVLPAKVVLVRVQASLLPDTEETIVPFDRSFNGKLSQATVGESRTLKLLDAWKSFDFSARKRLVKACMKTYGIQMMLSLLYIVCFVVELFIIVGTDFSKIFPDEGKEGL